MLKSGQKKDKFSNVKIPKNKDQEREKEKNKNKFQIKK